MAKYAHKTVVSPEKSAQQIQDTLKKYGASKFGYFSEESRVIIVFEIENRRVRFNIPLPEYNDTTKTVKQREQSVRQRWRALLLAIKAKLESVESGIETFEEAFMAHIILPDGKTIGEWATPQIQKTYESGNMPPLLGHIT